MHTANPRTVCTQHAMGMHSACTQHALSMQWACTQHAIGTRPVAIMSYARGTQWPACNQHALSPSVTVEMIGQCMLRCPNPRQQPRVVESAEMGAESPQVGLGRLEAHREATPVEEPRPRRQHAWGEEDLMRDPISMHSEDHGGSMRGERRT